MSYLLYNHSRVVTVNELIDVIFEEEELISPRGTIKNLVYRLRWVFKSIWPDIEFWETRHGGYQWNQSIPIELDTEKIDRLIKCTFDKDNWREGLDEWLELYKMNFLTSVSDVYWVSYTRLYYRSQYFSAMQKFYEYMDEEKEYILMEMVAKHGMSIDYEEEQCHYWFIHSCICQNKYSQAQEAYKDLIDNLYDGDEYSIYDHAKKIRQRIQIRDGKQDASIDAIVDWISKVKGRKTALFVKEKFLTRYETWNKAGSEENVEVQCFCC